MGAKAATGIEKKGTHDPTTAIFSLAGLRPRAPRWGSWSCPRPRLGLCPRPRWGSAPDPVLQVNTVQGGAFCVVSRSRALAFGFAACRGLRAYKRSISLLFGVCRVRLCASFIHVCCLCLCVLILPRPRVSNFPTTVTSHCSRADLQFVQRTRSSEDQPSKRCPREGA